MQYPYFNQKSIAFNLSQGIQTVLELLLELPVNELVVLQKNEDLLKRIQDIATMDTARLMRALREDFSLNLTVFSNGEMWIDIDKLEPAEPKWLCTRHSGWYVAVDEFLKFGRNFLLGEVRMNIYLRYLEHKSEKEERKVDLQGEDYGCYGQYI